MVLAGALVVVRAELSGHSPVERLGAIELWDRIVQIVTGICYLMYSPRLLLM
jgi:hypothetical protein